MSVKTPSDDPHTKKMKKNLIQKFSKPFRCISLPMWSLTFFVFYWFMLTPVLYYVFSKTCVAPKCTMASYWRYLFWLIITLIYVIIQSAVICYWSCSAVDDDDDNDEEEGLYVKKETPKENEKLLSEPIRYNDLKNDEKLHNLSIKNEIKSISKEAINRDDFNTTKAEGQIEKKNAALPLRKSMYSPEKEIVPAENVVTEEKPQESMIEEIDKMFPRCSTRRKLEHRKRPDTLIINSPKYPREDNEARRYTIHERPETASPLTPREVFFFDLIQGARKQTAERTEKFLDNERKHSSNNYSNARKPEVKDFILKQRSETEASSPEYFIANVPKRDSCTAEAFIYVDGGQSEEALTICYIDRDDDVFKN